MDDDCKDYRKSKPQQKIYKPGSGLLRRSRNGLDGKMETYTVDNGYKGTDTNHYGSQNSVNGDDVRCRQQSSLNVRHRKPEQQLYIPRSGASFCDGDRLSKAPSKSDNSSQNTNRKMSNSQENKHDSSNTSMSYSKGASGRDRSKADYQNKEGNRNDNKTNRHNRQVSETRSMSPAQSMKEQNLIDRNRDSRSMETWAGRHKSGSVGKPPSGRRNSAGYPTELSRSKHINLDNIPPRFRKKFLEQTGQSFEDDDQLHRDKHASSTQSINRSNQFCNTNTNWSQTLPSRGRGRLRDNEHFDKEKFISSYLKNCDVQNSRRSTPSSSYMNLYEPSVMDNRNANAKSDEFICASDIQNDLYASVSKNGVSNTINEKEQNRDLKIESEITENHKEEVVRNNTTSLCDMTNLDWTEEVEKNIKLDDIGDSSTSFSQNLKTSVSDEVKVSDVKESKRSGRTRQRDKRSSSRGQKNSEKKVERSRKDSNVSTQSKPERNRRDSNASIQHEIISSSLKHRERERRDSHRSNRSSTIGNSRDDLDKWRSLRSYSREQSSERRIISQCNSRDTSSNRALSPRDADGFKLPKPINTMSTNQKYNGTWPSGRPSSIERRRQSPASNHVGIGNKEQTGDGSGTSGGGGGRCAKKRNSRRRGRNTENVLPATHQPPGSTPAPTNINWREEILESKKHQAMNDRAFDSTHQRNRLNSVLSDKSMTESSSSQPGLIILPQGSMSTLQKDGRSGYVDTHKTLYDHQNPSKPIIVQTSPTKVDLRMEQGMKDLSSRGGMGYDAGDAARAARHVALLQKVDRADAILRTHTLRGPVALASHWNDVTETRNFLQSALQKLLMSDLKYCQSDNIEHQFWKILYYNFIEILRRSITQVPPEVKPEIVKLLNTIIEEGNVFFENLVQMLEKTYKFNTDDYLNDNHVLPPKGLGYVGLALISVQKLYVFLGDLARYKEQVNETNNYAKSKFWYTKAQQINPKNGRPYNQLALLAIYARRKLDAVYYYMRSLMSSNPFQSARESLLSLFDENRKKYEAAEKKRRAAESQRTGESSEASAADAGGGHGARREVWLRPGAQRAATSTRHHSDDERFDAMTPVELNKNFITSYLHVHGKLITKIGMETLHESAARMLRQFRALLHRQPLPTPAARLLQLTALNMFAVESNAASHKENTGNGERSAWLECALGVSLLMFGALLERCCALLPEAQNTQQHADALLLLPAIKVWSDWMLCHSCVWNPPPSFENFEIESDNDPWDWLAKLMNILEKLDDKSIGLKSEKKEGYVPVRLAEDASLAGFTPLMYIDPAVAWLRGDRAAPHHAAEHTLRTRKLLFFGTEYLVGVEPPVLKLEYPTGASPRYVSAVQKTQPKYQPLQNLAEDSDDEDSACGTAIGPTSLGEGMDELPEGADEATRRLLKRKEQLESRKATLERRRQRMQEMVGGANAGEVEVRPRWLVPDTNCFIDHLPLLQAIANVPGQPYTLAVPLVVVTELEGLVRRCERVGAAAGEARAWLSSANGVRLATARGTLLSSRVFTAECDHPRASNDDRVLATALNLHASLDADSAPNSTQEESEESSKGGRKVREVVLLTDDRNLRVKALASELPTRDLPSFVQWAGLSCADTTSANKQPGSGATGGHN